MLMGNQEGMMLYKHVRTRRYLNIDRTTGRTHAYSSTDHDYHEVPVETALAYVKG